MPGTAQLALAILVGAIVGFVALYGTSAFVSSRRVRRMLGIVAIVLITAVGAPSIWGVCLAYIVYGMNLSDGPQGMLVAAIPSALLVCGSIFVLGYARAIAIAACVGQSIASFLLAYMVGSSTDGHSDLTADFSILPFFAPVVAYAAAALLSGVIRKNWTNRQPVG